jgi:hypothetical protein
MSHRHQILGTIIASVLEYDELCRTIGDDHLINNEKSTYAPCDGRSILGSKLEDTGVANAPDLRGRFLRGLNVMYNHGEFPALDPALADPDGNDRRPGSYQADEFRSHSHSFGAQHMGGGLNGGGTGDLCLNRETSAAGGKETRPKNVAVYYYIKIN